MADLDPVIADIGRRQKEAGLADFYNNLTGPEARTIAEKARAQFYPKPDIPVGSSTIREIPGAGGNIRVSIVRPASGEASGSVVYYHGGGWIVGDIESHSAHAARIANRAGAVVVNVDYRLAPEHLFPAAVEDANVALRWANDNIGELGGDPSKLAVAGDSAGGNLAAVAALYARDNAIPLAAQLLIYGATDLSQVVGPPAKIYLGSDYEQTGRDPRASPVLAGSHEGLAPAIIGIGQHDWLYQKNLAYAGVLRKAGVDVILREFPTLGHSFFSHTGVSKASEDASNLISDDLRQLLHGPKA